MSSRLLLLGEDETRYGAYSAYQPDPEVACALSIGADPRSPGRASKKAPNEDALLVVVEGSRLLLAVADSHFGLEASHGLLTALERQIQRVPADPGELALQLLSLSEREARDRSATTLVVACADRQEGEVFGLSWGDSSALLVEPGGAAWLTRPNVRFVPAGAPVDVEGAHSFRTPWQSGQLLVLFTDGINECHYGEPLTSVTPADLAGLYGEPLTFVKGLTELALAGVRGFPGGQDNLALIAALR